MRCKYARCVCVYAFDDVLRVLDAKNGVVAKKSHTLYTFRLPLLMFVRSQYIEYIYIYCEIIRVFSSSNIRSSRFITEQKNVC